MTLDDQKVSTSQLAKKAGVESRKMFDWLYQGKWISRNEDESQGSAWELTAKGEFEGGEYFQSEKYGTYIVWPLSVLDHPMIQENLSKPITVTELGKSLGLSGRLVNAVMAECGLIEKHVNGWQLTDQGRKQGGLLQTHEKTGASYVVWPPTIADEEWLTAKLVMLSDHYEEINTNICLDHHEWSDHAKRRIDNWLYINQLTHACRRLLFCDEQKKYYRTDFYLPSHRVHIEYFGDDLKAEDLADKLAKIDYYEKTGLNFIQVNSEELADLDEILPRELLQFGIKVY